MDQKKLDMSLKLNREQLSSIDFSDIKEILEEELTDNELKERAGSCASFYNNNFEKVFKLFLQEQLEFIGKKANSLEELMFARGTINGLFLINDWFMRQINLSKASIQDKENEI